MKSKAAILLLLFMLASCSSPSVTPTIQPSPQETHIPLLPPPTVTAIPSATITPEADLPEGCINLSSTDNDSKKIDGLLAVSSREMGYHLLDPKTNQFVDLDKNGNPIFNLLRISLSPNKKYMLGLTNTDDYFVLKSTDKLITTNISISMGWDLRRWLDNEHIVLHGKNQSKQEMTIMNPFTGEQKTIRLDLPNIRILLQGPDFSIDPTLKRALYIDQDNRLILWNVETQKEMVSLPSPAWFWRSEFAWSRDGTKFATAWPAGSTETLLANDLYVFDMEGNLERLTDLNRKYGFANVDSPSWSPDGRQMGFWLNTGDGKTDLIHRRYWLAFLDVNTLETRVFCLTNKWPWMIPFDNIVWSPDGQQLIVSFGSWTDDTFTTILVDLTDQTQTVIDTRNMFVYDWMAP